MADICRELLAKRRQSGSTATVDDTEFTADVPTPTGRERCSLPVASARRHRPRTTLLLASTAGGRGGVSAMPALPLDALAPPGILYERQPLQPGDGTSTYTRVSNFGRFLTSKEGVDIYVNQLVREYMQYINFHVK